MEQRRASALSRNTRRATHETCTIRSVARPGVLQHPFTSQIVLAQVDLGHTLAQLANVRRELKAGVVAQLNGAPINKLPSQQRHGNRACSRDRWDLRLGVGCGDSSSEFLKAMCARTLELIEREIERLQRRALLDLGRDVPCDKPENTR